MGDFKAYDRNSGYRPFYLSAYRECFYGELFQGVLKRNTLRKFRNKIMLLNV